MIGLAFERLAFRGPSFDRPGRGPIDDSGTGQWPFPASKLITGSGAIGAFSNLVVQRPPAKRYPRMEDAAARRP